MIQRQEIHNAIEISQSSRLSISQPSPEKEAGVNTMGVGGGGGGGGSTTLNRSYENLESVGSAVTQNINIIEQSPCSVGSYSNQRPPTTPQQCGGFGSPYAQPMPMMNGKANVDANSDFGNLNAGAGVYNPIGDNAHFPSPVNNNNTAVLSHSPAGSSGSRRSSHSIPAVPMPVAPGVPPNPSINYGKQIVY